MTPETLAGLRLQRQVTVTVVVRVVAHFPGRPLVTALAAALLAGVFRRVELAARALAGQAVPVDRAVRVDPAGTVARADRVGMAGQADTVVDIADSRVETPNGACSP